MARKSPTRLNRAEMYGLDRWPSNTELGLQTISHVMTESARAFRLLHFWCLLYEILDLYKQIGRLILEHLAKIYV